MDTEYNIEGNERVYWPENSKGYEIYLEIESSDNSENKLEEITQEIEIN
jgi:hypothetical protein